MYFGLQSFIRYVFCKYFLPVCDPPMYGFCHTLTWISHGFTCVPHPEPPSHLPPHPIPLDHFLIISQSTEFQVGSFFFFFPSTLQLFHSTLIVCKDSEKFYVILTIVPIWLKCAPYHHPVAAYWLILSLIFYNLKEICLGVVFQAFI